jgi:hypothetical protein
MRLPGSHAENQGRDFCQPQLRGLVGIMVERVDIACRSVVPSGVRWALLEVTGTWSR